MKADKPTFSRISTKSKSELSPTLLVSAPPNVSVLPCFFKRSPGLEPLEDELELLDEVLEVEEDPGVLTSPELELVELEDELELVLELELLDAEVLPPVFDEEEHPLIKTAVTTANKTFLFLKLILFHSRNDFLFLSANSLTNI